MNTNAVKTVSHYPATNLTRADLWRGLASCLMLLALLAAIALALTSQSQAQAAPNAMPACDIEHAFACSPQTAALRPAWDEKAQRWTDRASPYPPGHVCAGRGAEWAADAAGKTCEPKKPTREPVAIAPEEAKDLRIAQLNVALAISQAQAKANEAQARYNADIAAFNEAVNLANAGFQQQVEAIRRAHKFADEVRFDPQAREFYRDALVNANASAKDAAAPSAATAKPKAK